MKIRIKRSLMNLLMLIFGVMMTMGQVYSQEARQVDSRDESTVKKAEPGSVDIQDQKVKQNQPSEVARNAANQQKEKSSTVKRVKGSSPDMSKKRGARPPSISRPAGNAMPKGAGKPAGAFRPGRR